jgi:hypothetical protein
MESEKIIVELSEKIVKYGLYTSKGGEIEGIAKKLGIKVRKIGKDDLDRVRKILSKGEPLSGIVIEQRGT